MRKSTALRNTRFAGREEGNADRLTFPANGWPRNQKFFGRPAHPCWPEQRRRIPPPDRSSCSIDRMKKVKSGKRGPAAKGKGAPKSVDEYLAGVPEPGRGTLDKIRAAIPTVVPPG